MDVQGFAAALDIYALDGRDKIVTTMYKTINGQEAKFAEIVSTRK